MAKKEKKKKKEVTADMAELVPVEEKKDGSVGSLVPKAVIVALKELLPRIDCSFIKPKDFYIDKDGNTQIEFIVGDEYEVFITVGSEKDTDTMTTGEKYAIRVNSLLDGSYRKLSYECYESVGEF